MKAFINVARSRILHVSSFGPDIQVGPWNQSLKEKRQDERERERDRGNKLENDKKGTEDRKSEKENKKTPTYDLVPSPTQTQNTAGTCRIASGKRRRNAQVFHEIT